MKNRLNEWIKYSTLGFQILATMLLGILAGQWLDKKFHSEDQWFTLACSLLAVFVVIYQLYRWLIK